MIRAIRPKCRWPFRCTFAKRGAAAPATNNRLVHLDFQFRGNFYIYVEYTHFWYSPGAGMAPFVSYARRLNKVHMDVVLFRAALTGLCNLPVARVGVADCRSIRAEFHAGRAE
ncbi:MAG TPA: hypothetical protein DDZ81_16690 [Acetobacteraceae bacterium]|jgi:hypothetical protein|nr:hypothetical protein [Acetobacteraceae bacterium]